MILKAGKFYKTSTGVKVRIYATDAGGVYTCHGAMLEEDGTWASDTWMIDGTYDLANIEDNENNIESEWFEKPVFRHWYKLAYWANKYIAMDENGKWYSYGQEPWIKNGNGVTNWYVPGETYEKLRIPEEFYPEFNGHWKDSLIEKPKLNELFRRYS